MTTVADRLGELSELMQAVYHAYAQEGIRTPDEVARLVEGNASTIRTYSRRLDELKLLQRDSHGNYTARKLDEAVEEVSKDHGQRGLATPKPAKELLSEQQLNMMRNAAILFRDANTGEVFFSLDFPSYMRVWNPYVVSLRHPDVDNGEAEMIEKGEDVG